MRENTIELPLRHNPVFTRDDHFAMLQLTEDSDWHSEPFISFDDLLLENNEEWYEREAWEMAELYYQFVFEPHPLELQVPRYGHRAKARHYRAIHRDEAHHENRSNTLKERQIRQQRQLKRRLRNERYAM